jgi:SAM-dependent methyltransferase
VERIAASVERHYGLGGRLEAIFEALRAMGKDLESLTPADLASVDEFHIRGREATMELARLAALSPGLRVLDVGCGLGGSTRYLASTYSCHVTGIDLTREYCEVAAALSERVGLAHLTDFHHTLVWEDTTATSLDWFRRAVEQMKTMGPAPLGLHLLMGMTARTKFENNIRNLEEGRIVVSQAVLERVR